MPRVRKIRCRLTETAELRTGHVVYGYQFWLTLDFDDGKHVLDGQVVTCDGRPTDVGGGRSWYLADMDTGPGVHADPAGVFHGLDRVIAEANAIAVGASVRDL